MILAAIAGLATLAFILSFRASGLLSEVRSAVDLSQEALGTMASAALDEDEKEARVRAAAIKMFKAVFMIAVRASIALAGPVIVLWAAQVAGFATMTESVDFLLKWEVILALTLLSLGAWAVLRRFSPRPAGEGGSETEEAAAAYSAADRLLHNAVLSQPDLQRGLAALEDRVASRSLGKIVGGAPVFITSMPRAGTTLILEILCADPRFVSHTYRNMPMLLAPMVWNRLSGPFRRSAVSKERAHGDGMTVDYDSVEAFEEIIWRAFFPNQYKSDRIVPWRPDEPDQDGNLPGFLRRHMKKLIVLRRRKTRTDEPERYVSKNNANISRIDYLLAAFPDARIVVPFREPLSQAVSLARQHANFLEAHRNDRFARDYMESLGHLEFGETLRPIDFDGFVDRAAAEGLDPLSEDFWCEYWIAAFEALRRAVGGDSGSRVLLLSYDDLCRRPESGLEALADWLALSEDSAVRQQHVRFRSPSGRKPDGIDPDRAARATELYEELRSMTRHEPDNTAERPVATG